MIIRAYGEPAPQGSKRTINKGNANRPATIGDASPKLAPWRSDVIAAAREVLTRQMLDCLDGPIIARMVFSFRRPKSVKFSKRPFPSVYPDLSKLCRSTEDALKAAGVIADDSLIVEYTRLAKVYCGEDEDSLETPGAYIIIARLEPREGISK
jgi:Holliday junction resolvase RusA-like endonuclease